MAVGSEEFRHALGRFASGVTVVTVADERGQVSGLTVSAFSSVSLSPPLILVCIDNRSTSIPVIESVGSFAVNVLTKDQAHLSNRFASRDADKFAGVTWSKGSLGLPLLSGSLAQLECTVAKTVNAGDHTLFIGQVEATYVEDSAQPLLYFNGNYGNFLHQ